MEDIEQKEFYYPGGRLKAERSYRQGVPHGRHREWHENGVLASEVYLKDCVPDGIGRQWDEKGNLVVEYEIKDGTGIQKLWFAEQGIRTEVSWINGTKTGRSRTYLIDGGAIVSDRFWIKNREVSKKHYLKACKTDLNLPRYEEDTRCSVSPAPRSTSQPVDTGELEKSILASGATFEARAWLNENGVPERSLGETTSREDSIELVESLYRAGAVTVWVFDVNGGPSEMQNSGRLLLELPASLAKRKRVLAKCAKIGAERGFEPESDTGQCYTILMLD